MPFKGVEEDFDPKYPAIEDGANGQTPRKRVECNESKTFKKYDDQSSTKEGCHEGDEAHEGNEVQTMKMVGCASLLYNAMACFCSLGPEVVIGCSLQEIHIQKKILCPSECLCQNQHVGKTRWIPEMRLQLAIKALPGFAFVSPDKMYCCLPAPQKKGVLLACTQKKRSAACKSYVCVSNIVKVSFYKTDFVGIHCS